METKQQIRYLERKRDWNLSIHCPKVAARYQREIDRLKEELKELEDGNEDDDNLF